MAQITANASFDRTAVATGDTFTLRVLVSGARVAPSRVSFASWLQQVPTENILSRSAWTRSGAKWVQQFTLIHFDTAALVLPPLTVQLHLNDTIRTNPLQLTVTAPAASASLADMEDIREIYREPVMWYDHWPWAVGVLLLLVLLRWWLPRTRRAKPVPQPVPLEIPPPPAHEQALQQLEDLRREKPWASGGLLEYYARLSLIVRGYLEARYGIPALESTTREIKTMLKKTAFPDAQRSTLEFLLQQADLVKYAEMEPPEQYHEQALAKAVKLVRETAVETSTL